MNEKKQFSFTICKIKFSFFKQKIEFTTLYKFLGPILRENFISLAFLDFEFIDRDNQKQCIFIPYKQ